MLFFALTKGGVPCLSMCSCRPWNILEEIVWYKDVEINGWRMQQSLAELQVRSSNGTA
jgi:hypothetical protein